MGRIILFLLIVATAIMLWQAFAPEHLRFGSARRPKQNSQQDKELPPKGPDDDPDFLWNIKKERFKEQRRREAEEEKRRRNQDPDDPEPPAE